MRKSPVPRRLVRCHNTSWAWPARFCWRPAGRLTALAHLDHAIAGIDEPGVGFYLPEIYRLRGECLLALDRDNKEAGARRDRA